MAQQIANHYPHQRLAIAALVLWSVAIVLVVTFLFDTWPHAWLKDDQREPWFHALVVLVLTLLAFCCNYLHHHVVDARERRAPDPTAPAGEAVPREGLIPRIFGSWLAIIVIFLLPTAVYFGAHTLHSPLPEPAIFVMAVVAIYVAAEHYASLDKQRKNLRWVTEELGKQVFSIQNALGSRDGRHRLYAEYSQFAVGDPAPWEHGHPVHAIVRHLDIDEDWLRAEGWDDYMASQRTTSLVAALRHGGRRRLRIVTALETPLARSPDSDVDTADRFQHFMGLLWHWLALRKLQTEQADFDFRIAIAETPHWVHVVNRKVLQVAGAYPHDLRIRDITLDIGDMAPRVEAWVRDDIETRCANGQRAEACIADTLQTALAQARAPGQSDRLDYAKVLDALGWAAWAAHAETRYGTTVPPAAAHPKFVSLIQTFLTLES